MTPEERASLEEQRDVLLRSLRDLEAERAAGDIGEADYTTLKDDYTARAAAVLRALDAASRPRPRTAAPRPRPRPRPRPARGKPNANVPVSGRQRTLAVSLAVAFAIVAVAGLSVVIFSGDREPGQPVTGSGPDTSTSTATATAPDRVAEALALENDNQPVEALKIYDEILADDPDNVEAHAYRGWLLKRAGLVDEALMSLDRAVTLDPTFPDARFFRGMVLYQDRDDPAGAVEEFKAFLANDPPPEFVAAVQEVLAKAEAAAAAKAAGVTTVAP